ncbi:Glycoside hydrolase, superfamily [Niveomyces insectorum RCEF 264]|uniref:beta-glucosidase n=1 Tax=Niveomyces insectorum RCEF 264 TaxID=1081102 RepID=A0A167UWX7_9HYPO|nr:Glycoside hydrolase, superfamily [Niveomyces insectorum RCEF 264]
MPLSYSISLAALAGLLPAFAAAASLPIYKNASYTAQERAADLLPRLSWQDKVGQMGGVRRILAANLAFNQTSYDALTEYQNGILGFGNRLNDPARVLQMANQLREDWANKSLVPFITVTDTINGPYVEGGTLFPPTLSVAATFNVDLYGDVVAAIRDENMALGTHWVLSPELDVPKDPRYGRVGETYGEDPLVVGRFGLKYVDTMQEADEDGYMKVACTIKHFIYGNPNGGINLASQYGGLNYLYNNLFPPFIQVIQEADPPPASVMVSYTSVDRVPMAVNKYLLQDHLRQNIGFRGVLMSDAGEVPNLYTLSLTADSAETAALRALRAGMQLELAPSDAAFPRLIDHVNETDVADLINQAVRQILEIKFQTGTFDKPLPTVDNLKATFRAPAHLAINRNFSREAIVLLQNENNTLPLSVNRNGTGKIALLGPFADVVVAGTYAASNATNKTFGNALRQSLEAAVGASNVLYEPGVDFVDTSNASGIAAAVAAARDAGLAIVNLGSLAVQVEDPLAKKNTDGELYTHADLGFPGLQQDLLDAVLDTGVPTVLVITGGQAFALHNRTLSRTGAILHSFLAGEYTADALVEILVGKVNPSGKLPISMPESSGSVPVAYDYLPSDGVLWTYPGTSRAVKYAFGFGLSYTAFDYAQPSVTKATTAHGEPAVNVSVTVTNKGAMDGQEVVQVYFRQQYTSIETPTKRLIDFAKVGIAAGAAQTVTFTIKVNDLGFYVNGDWTWEAGNYTFYVGSSSRSEDLAPVSIVL